MTDKVVLQKTHASMVQVRMRAEALVGANHYDPQSVRAVSEDVTTRWQGLVSIAEERHRLAQAAVRFFKTAEQVNNGEHCISGIGKFAF